MEVEAYRTMPVAALPPAVAEGGCAGLASGTQPRAPSVCDGQNYAERYAAAESLRYALRSHNVGGNVANERLRSCIAEAGLTVAQVAEEVGVDPKTVERWVSTGRFPHRSHRASVAALLRIDEVYLWPQTLDEKRSVDVSRAELITLYPTRGAVPKDVWLGLLERARARIDILTYSSLFLPDSYSDFGDRLAARVDAGASVRLLFGDPESDAVRLRGQEERIGEGMASRIRLSLSYLREVRRHPKIEFRLHSTALYNSIYRFDDDMLVNAHTYGAPAVRSIVLHLRSLGGGSIFEHYEESFERVWSDAVPAGDDE